MVGADGVVGASAALDGRISLSRGIIQLSGDIVICSIEGLKSVALSSPRLLSLLIRHEQTVYAQAQQSAACFASHHVEERFCRWLLRARDLSGSDDLPFTQEYLAEMLGVRRTSVTGVARSLQETGIIPLSLLPTCASNHQPRCSLSNRVLVQWQLAALIRFLAPACDLG